MLNLLHEHSKLLEHQATGKEGDELEERERDPNGRKCFAGTF